MLGQQMSKYWALKCKAHSPVLISQNCEQWIARTSFRPSGELGHLRGRISVFAPKQYELLFYCIFLH